MNNMLKALPYPILTQTVESGWNLLCPLGRTHFIHKSSDISCDRCIFSLGKPPPKGSARGEGGRGLLSREKFRKKLMESYFQKPRRISVTT